jgi:hypothetical protein
VTEVLVGLIEGDSQSYLRADPDSVPTCGQASSFTTVDLLNTADVVTALP